jgi:hypothetical protein
MVPSPCLRGVGQFEWKKSFWPVRDKMILNSVNIEPLLLNNDVMVD